MGRTSTFGSRSPAAVACRWRKPSVLGLRVLSGALVFVFRCGSRVVVVPAVSGGHIVVRRWRADDALRCGRAAADAWFSGIRMSAGDSYDIPNSSECAVGCGQYAVRVHAVGFQWFVSVVSDEFLFGADRRLPVPEHTGVVAMVGSREAIAFRIP